MEDSNIRRFANHYLHMFPKFIEYYQDVGSVMRLITNNSDILQNPVCCKYDRHVQYNLPVYNVEHLLGFFHDCYLHKRTCKDILLSSTCCTALLCYLWESFFYDHILYSIGADNMNKAIESIGSRGIIARQFRQLCKFINYSNITESLPSYINAYAIFIAEAEIKLNDLITSLSVDLPNIDVDKTEELLVEQFIQFSELYEKSDVPESMLLYILKLLYTHYVHHGQLFDGLCVDTILLATHKLRENESTSLSTILSGDIESGVQNHLNLLRRVESLALELSIDPFNILRHLDYNNLESSFDMLSEQLTEGSF